MLAWHLAVDGTTRLARGSTESHESRMIAV